MKEKIMIIYGGKSVEHDISIITALQTFKFIPKKYDCMLVYISKDGKWWVADNLQDINVYSNFEKNARKARSVSFVLGENKLLVEKHGKFTFMCKIACVVNCCHGNIGEDGAVQGLFKTCGVSHTSPGILSSALCMDKAVMKDVLKANEILTPQYLSFKEYDKTRILKKLKFPLIVKPSNLGSSIAISVCKDEQQLDEAVELAFEFDEKVLVEKLVENLREYNCACFYFNDKCFVSHVNEVTNKGEIFSFEDKYLSSGSKNQEADKTLTRKIKTLTEKVYKLFDCKGIVRVDFLYDEQDEKLYVNEVNTIPGSLAFYLFKDIKFDEILDAVISQSLADSEREQKLIKTFESDALKTFENVSNSFKK